MSSSLLDLDEFSAADNCYGKFQQQQQQLNLNASLNDSLSRSYAFCNFLIVAAQGSLRRPGGNSRVCDSCAIRARSPAKAICTIDRRTTRILTANTVFGQLFKRLPDRSSDWPAALVADWSTRRRRIFCGQRARDGY
uniref:GATA-type domain-containing protein n=1 Tax=Macrostomum lignano TaxID=282301 RepID=A0A1I8FBG3_9PLAT